MSDITRDESKHNGSRSVLPKLRKPSDGPKKIDANDVARADKAFLKQDLENTQITEGVSRRIQNDIWHGCLDFDAAEKFDSQKDDQCIFGHRFWCKGQPMVFVGPSGYGKSSLMVQLAFSLALGRPFFGMASKQKEPLRTLIFQAENDFGDMAEQYQGFIKGFKLKPGEKVIAKGNVRIVRDAETRNEGTFNRLRLMLKSWPFDVAIIDPFFSFFAGDSSDQEAISNFMRDLLMPFCEETNVAVILTHHTRKGLFDRNGKPKQNLKPDDMTHGSQEILNAARASMVLLPKSGKRFELIADKRGVRARFRRLKERSEFGGSDIHHEGFSNSVMIQHSKAGLCWEQCVEEGGDQQYEFKLTEKMIEGVLDKYEVNYRASGLPSLIAAEQSGDEEKVTQAKVQIHLTRWLDELQLIETGDQKKVGNLLVTKKGPGFTIMKLKGGKS